LQIPFQPTPTDLGRHLVLKPMQQAIGIDIDCSENRVFWSDIVGGNIYSSDYTGHNLQTFINNSKFFSPSFRLLCSVVKCLACSKNWHFLIFLFLLLDVGSAEGLSIDWLSRNIFWTDSSRDTIEVASLDDSSLRKVIINKGLVNPRGIAVHPTRG